MKLPDAEDDWDGRGNSAVLCAYGLAGLLTFLFIALKLMHFFDWSWWWVLSPLWISAGLTVLGLLTVAALFLLGPPREL